MPCFRHASPQVLRFAIALVLMPTTLVGQHDDRRSVVDSLLIALEDPRPSALPSVSEWCAAATLTDRRLF
jgi:hypothetical protein